MPHVSKYKLEKDILNTILKDLYTVLVRIEKKKHAGHFLDSILTPTEKIMIAKRLAIALMLLEEYPFRIIGKTLKVSEATVSTIKERLDRDGEGFEMMWDYVRGSSSQSPLLRKIEKLVRLFAMPPYAGKGRWQFFEDSKK